MLALIGFLLAFAGVPATAQGGHVEIRFATPVTSANAFLLDDPARIAIDITGPMRGIPVAAPANMVTAVRQGPHGPGRMRIVLDLARYALIADGRLAPDGRALTLTLRAADSTEFARGIARGRQGLSASAVARPSPAAPVRRLPAYTGIGRLPRILGGASSLPLVVIDAGHGGHDPGAISGGLREKDLTLATALAIRDALLATGRVRVALTRESDRYLILRDRFGIARALGADLFISVHCDSAANPDASGGSIYTLSDVASDKEAARLAARENKADILSGVDLGDQSADISSILIEMARRETLNVSAGFARRLGREAQPLVPMKGDFHRMASLMVLKASDVPSVLFEMGYISNPDDARRLDSMPGRRRIAEGVQRAVLSHFASELPVP